MKTFGTISLMTVTLLIGDHGSARASRWTHYLPLRDVTSIQYDSVAHILWFGTGNNGISRFDGQEFDNFRPITVTGRVVNQVTALALDRVKQELWVGSPKGLFRYHIQTNQWEHYTPGLGLSQIYITALFVDSRGTLWYGSETEDGRIGGGVGKRDSLGWYRYTTAGYEKWNAGAGVWVPDTNVMSIPADQIKLRDFVESIAEDSKDNMYFGTGGAGLCILQATGMWDCSAQLEGDNNTIKAIAIDRDGNKWLGTPNGVCLLDIKSKVTYFKAPLVAHNFVNSIWIEPFQNGDIKWFGTDGGISVLDSTNQRWKSIRTSIGGLASNRVLDIIGDRDGNLWFGLGELKGVSKLNNNWFELTRQDRLSSNVVRAVIKDGSGRLWAVTDASDSVEILVGGTWKRVELTDAACEGEPLVSDFLPAPDRTGMWIATLGCGLFRVSNELRVTGRIRVNTPAEFPSNVILKLAGKNDTLWAGTTAGLVRLLVSPKEIKVDKIFNRGNVPAFPGDTVSALAFDKRGRLWIGTNRGITVFDGTRWSDPQFSLKVAINAIARDSTDVMWVGSNAGAAQFDGKQWRYYSTAEGLPDNRVASVEVAHDGTIWFGTVNGAASFVEKRWTTYTTDDGLSDNFIFDITFGPPEVVWFATNGGGIARYRKTSIRPETLLLETFSLVTKTDVTFRYSGYDLNTPALDLRYQFAMDNPSDWLPITFAPTVTLPIQEDGLHTFYVRAIDKDGNVDASPAKFRFHKVRFQRGGAATIVDSTRVQKFGSLRIYVPPNALPEGVAIHAKPVAIDTAGLAQQKLSFTGIAYDLGPADVTIEPNKPLTLTIIYKGAIAPQDERRLAIYHRDGVWSPLGGSVDTERHTITTAIAKLNTIALFEDRDAERPGQGVAGISNVTAQPRILSPQGGGFNENVMISFDLGQPAEATVKVYNLSGRLVRALCENRSMNPGRNVIEWNGRDYNNTICSSGLYIVTIEAAGSMATKQVVVLNE